MNAYVPLLRRAVSALPVNSAAARRGLYERARLTLNEQLTVIAKTHADVDIAVERRKLEAAITGIEASLAAPPPVSLHDEVVDTPEGFAADTGAWHSGQRESPPRHLRRASLRMSLLRALLKFSSDAGRLLTNPWVLFGSLFLGVYVGLYQKTAAAVLAPVADIYIELLKMVLLPFMISAIVLSLSRLFGSESMTRHVAPILTTFILTGAAVAFIGIGSAVVLSPGEGISSSSRQTLGQLINSSPYAVDLEISLDDPDNTSAQQTNSGSLISQLIPDNIFQALTIGDNLKILFFAIAFGVGLGSLRLNKGDGLRAALLSVYEVCTQIIAAVNLMLPVALCAMVAKQVASVGAAQLLAMLRFMAAFGVTALVVCIVAVVVVALCTRSGVWRAFAAMRQPVLIAIATRSSVTCIPSSVTALVDGLGFSRSDIELIVPLGITLFRFGPILYYAFTTVFVAQLYGVSLSVETYAFILVAAVFTGLASAGTTGVLTLSLIGVIFQPLGLPLEAALALLVIIDPVCDIFRTVSIVLPNCAAAAMIYRKHRSPVAVEAPSPAE
jgi:Na+/H+-dicarboxylate symporter